MSGPGSNIGIPQSSARAAGGGGTTSGASAATAVATGELGAATTARVARWRNPSTLCRADSTR